MKKKFSVGCGDFQPEFFNWIAALKKTTKKTKKNCFTLFPQHSFHAAD